MRHLGRNVRMYDVGGIDGPNRSLEQLQQKLGTSSQAPASLIPIVLVAVTGNSLRQLSRSQVSLIPGQAAVINMDAHFDLRPTIRLTPVPVFVKCSMTP